MSSRKAALDYSANEREIGDILGVPARRVAWEYKKAVEKLGAGLVRVARELGLDWDDPAERREITRALMEIFAERRLCNPTNTPASVPEILALPSLRDRRRLSRRPSSTSTPPRKP